MRFSPFLWLLLAFLLLCWVLLFRYEPIPGHVVESASSESVRHLVWDRWGRRLCVAFLGREELACTPDELKTAAGGLEISNEVVPQAPTVMPSFVSIDEVKKHLDTQIKNVGFVEKMVRTERNLVVYGWAADPAAGSPAVAVHVFNADKEVTTGIPNLPRPDVAKLLNVASSNQFGFHIMAPVASTSMGDIHVFAQLHDGSFVELMMLPAR